MILKKNKFLRSMILKKKLFLKSTILKKSLHTKNHVLSHFTPYNAQVLRFTCTFKKHDLEEKNFF